MENKVILSRGNPTEQPVGIGPEARAQSTYVIGITGTGKSTLLENMAYQDIANRDGICFLDPHGDSSRKLISSIPDYRRADVIFWDPADTGRPFGLNPFYCKDPKNEDEVSKKAQSFIDALASLKEFAEIFKSAPRMRNMLYQLALTFIINQGYTLAEASKFLLDEEYRRQFYPALSGRFARIRRYWELELDSLSVRDRQKITESSLNKLERLQTSSVLYAVFGQSTSSIDFRKAMDSGAIIIINLGADEGGFIGAFVVWEILQAAFSRRDIPEHMRRTFHLFADEFQVYMTTAFPKLQAEARKYGLDTVIAHQVRAQLAPEIADITKAVGNLVVFHVTSDNAEALAREFNTTPPMPPETTLSKRQAYLTLSPDPWKELFLHGHKNPEVVGILTRLKKLFYYRNHWFGNQQEHDQRFGSAASGIVVETTYITKGPWKAGQITVKTTHPMSTDYSKSATLTGILEKSWSQGIYFYKEVPFETFGEQANPYLLAMEQGQEASRLFEEMMKDLTNVVGLTDLYMGKRVGHPNGRDYSALRKDNDLTKARFQSAERARDAVNRRLYALVKEAFTKDLRRLGEILKEEPVMIDSRQYVEEREVLRPVKTYADMAAEIVNQLVWLPNYWAKVKIGHAKGKPTEHLIQTYDFPGAQDEEVARRLKDKSREVYGRDRAEVEQAIEKRLQTIKEKREEEEPVLREKSRGKRNSAASGKGPRL